MLGENTTIREWMALTEADPQAAAEAWRSLSAEDRKAVRAAVARAESQEGLLAGPLRALGQQLGAVVRAAALDAVI